MIMTWKSFESSLKWVKDEENPISSSWDMNFQRKLIDVLINFLVSVVHIKSRKFYISATKGPKIKSSTDLESSFKAFKLQTEK